MGNRAGMLYCLSRYNAVESVGVERECFWLSITRRCKIEIVILSKHILTINIYILSRHNSNLYKRLSPQKHYIFINIFLAYTYIINKVQEEQQQQQQQ